jgi:glycogen(starch) synthase
LLWSELFWPHLGGVEVLALEFVCAMRKRGYEFLVVTSHGPVEAPDRGNIDEIPIHRLPLRAVLSERDMAGLLASRRKVAEIKRSFQADLVHLFALGPSTFFHLQTRDAHPAPMLLTLHGEVLRGNADGADSVLERALGSADWVTSVSEAALRAARDLVPEIAARSSVAHSGVRDVAVAPSVLPFDPPRLLCVARLVRDKGIDLALGAMALLSERFPALQMRIAGDGPARADLQAQASALGLGERVEFLGWVRPERIADVMNSASIVVMPSRRESMPLVALQAGQMARPVAAANVGGLPEVVADGRTGILVPPEDPSALAAAIAGLLERPDHATRLGQAALERVRSEFSWERHLDAIELLYRKLLAPRTRGIVALD